MTKIKKYPIYFGYINGYRLWEVRSIGHKWVWLREGPYKNKDLYGQFKKIRRSEWDKAKMITHEEFMWQSKVKTWAKGEIHQRYDADGKPCGASIINNMNYEYNKKYKHGYRLRSFEEIEALYVEAMEKKRMFEVAA